MFGRGCIIDLRQKVECAEYISIGIQCVEKVKIFSKVRRVFENVTILHYIYYKLLI